VFRLCVVDRNSCLHIRSTCGDVTHPGFLLMTSRCICTSSKLNAPTLADLQLSSLTSTHRQLPLDGWFAQHSAMVKPGETWLITGASRGIGLQYVIQVIAPHSLADPNACPPTTS
jgi:hypothetical protein